MGNEIERVFVSVKVTRVVGDDTVTFEQGQYCEPGERLHVADIMSQTCAEMFRRYLDNTAPTMPANPIPSDDGGIGGEWQAVTRVQVMGEGDNKRVFCFTDEYHVYGIELFPEVAARAGYMWAGFKSDFKPNDWSIWIKRNGKGRPKIYALKTPSSIED